MSRSCYPEGVGRHALLQSKGLRPLAPCVAVFVVTGLLTAGPAPADGGPGQRATEEEAKTCDAWDVEYRLAANLQVTDTTLGKGDGVYKIGPGRVVLRFDDRDGQPTGNAKMLSYTMQVHMTVEGKALFWSAKATTDTKTTVTEGACTPAAEGALTDHTLRWSTKVRGYRYDGTVLCEGSLCGKFGAPAAGTTPIHVGPTPVEFKPFEFSADMKTFTMPYTLVSKTDSPKQTAYVTLAGREASRACVQIKPCK
jgi:hypothetical protein